MAASDIMPFGHTASGSAVQAVTLRSGPTTARILTLGAAVQDFRLSDAGRSLTLGSDRVADYEGPTCFHGSLIAPVANRIAGSRARVAGQDYALQPQAGQPHILHSGGAGTWAKLWAIRAAEPASVTLACRLPDGEGGFPGNRDVAVTYSLSGSTCLRMEVTAATDRPTIFNVANHSYWNLDGTATWSGHRLEIAADFYLPATDEVLPTGEIAAVDGTPFDFRKGRVAGPGNPPLDTCFCLSRGQVPIRPVLTLTGASGLMMTLATTEPGVQIYDGRFTARPGCAAGEGLAIEAQGWPDAPNHPDFPPILLNPGQTYRQITEWRFSRP